MSRRRHYKQHPEPARCKCEGGADRAPEHGKPRKKAADHGDPYGPRPKKPCIHSELLLTTAPLAKKHGVARIRLR